MKPLSTLLLPAALLTLSPTAAEAQVNAADSVMNHASGKRFSVGGYGEVA